MTETTQVELTSCPEVLQQAAADLLHSQQGASVVSVTLTESTPYMDKAVIHRKYRVILNYLNMVSILFCFDNDEILGGKVFSSDLIWGDIVELLRSGAPGTLMDTLWGALPADIKSAYSK